MAGLVAGKLVGTDVRACVSIQSFAAESGEEVTVPGFRHYLMDFTLGVRYERDCVWRAESGNTSYSPWEVDQFRNIEADTVGDYITKLYEVVEEDETALSRAEVYPREIHEAAKATLQFHGELPSRETFVSGVLSQLATFLQYDSPQLTAEAIQELEISGRSSYQSYGFRSGQASDSELVAGSIVFRHDDSHGWVAIAIRGRDSE